MTKRVSLLIAVLFFVTSVGTAFGAGASLTAGQLAKAPTVDGKGGDWGGVSGVKIKVKPGEENDAKNYTGEIDVEMKAGVHGGKIYVMAQWPDDSEDKTHKTLHWSAEKDKYVAGKDREDRLAINFDMEGDFHSCMLSGTEYKADMWHWKAYRSQTAGIAHDKMHIITFAKAPKAKEHKGRNGKTLWIARPSDKGGKIYKSQRPIDNIGASVPRYLVDKSVSGSIADVKTAAVWADGKWTLEMVRDLDTGNADDVKFAVGKTYSAGLAVFNHTGDDHHSTSPFTLTVK